VRRVESEVSCVNFAAGLSDEVAACSAATPVDSVVSSTFTSLTRPMAQLLARSYRCS